MSVKKGTKNLTTPYSIPFLNVLYQNKALHNFYKKGQCDIAANVIKKSKERDAVFVPSLLVNNEPTSFVINNTDLKINTADGKDQPQGTAIAVYQQLQNQTKVPISQVLFLDFQVIESLA